MSNLRRPMKTPYYTTPRFEPHYFAASGVKHIPGRVLPTNRCQHRSHPDGPPCLRPYEDPIHIEPVPVDPSAV